MDSNNKLAQRSQRAMRAALGRMVRKYPYHARWLSCDHWRESSRVPTMAVTTYGGCIRFHYDASFVCNCTEDELDGVIHHELNHVVFRHPFANPKDYPDRHARVIAEEVTVNEHVPEPLPGHPLTIADFPELPPGEDTHTRYLRLLNRTDLADRVRLMDLHALWNDHPSNDTWQWDMTAIHRTLNSDKSGSNLELIYAIHRLKSARGLRGGPARVTSLDADSATNISLDWKRILETFAGVRLEREATFGRPPRRLPNFVGVVPGYRCRPDLPKIMAVIDTSRSMETSDLERVRAELQHIVQLCQVTLVQCDTMIRETYPFRGTLPTIVGHGGTDLRPPFDRSVIDAIRPSAIIYFTDGDGPAPDQAPHMPVIWCLTSSASRAPAWGHVVRMRPRGDLPVATG